MFRPFAETLSRLCMIHYAIGFTYAVDHMSYALRVVQYNQNSDSEKIDFSFTSIKSLKATTARI